MNKFKPLHLNSLCNKCLGCEKLDNMSFAGVFDCKSFYSMESDEGLKKAKKIIEQMRIKN